MTDTQEMTDTQRMSKLNSYYFNSELSDNENENSVVRKLINKYQVEENSETDSMDYNVKRNKDRQSEIRMITCKLCLDENTDKGNYIILSCNHIYHIKCLAEEHFNDVLKYPLIDNDYFESRKCNICLKNLQAEEMMYLHSKFLSNTKDLLDKHQISITELEDQMTKIKNDLRVCYDYKHKLEQEREKSKQIVSILSTMI
jgi:hypothetical protein|uniref:RING-type domain-containing protein n=1 Tax=viral metagenome TaxID=1070528 RepID=A0A6C0DW14_9ZZZZ